MAHVINDDHDLFCPDLPDEHHHCPKTFGDQGVTLQGDSGADVQDMKSRMGDLLKQVKHEYERQISIFQKQSHTYKACFDAAGGVGMKTEVQHVKFNTEELTLEPRTSFDSNLSRLSNLASMQPVRGAKRGCLAAQPIPKPEGEQGSTKPNSRLDSLHQLPIRECWNIQVPEDAVGFFQQDKRASSFVPKLWYEPRQSERSVLRFAASMSFATKPKISRFFAEEEESVISFQISISDSESMCGGWLHTVHPQSAWRVAWDMITLVLITMDLITIPLAAFDFEPNDEMREFVLFGAAFWTMDVFLSFLTGIYVDGELDMRLGSIVNNYIKGWLLLDVALVIVEWLVCMRVFDFGGKLATRSGRYTRMIKGFRAIKAARFFKLLPLFSKLEDSIFSLTVLFFFKVFKSILVLLFLNHVIACVWYDVGKNSDGWPQLEEFAGEPRDYLYLVSFHWAIGHFMGSIMIAGENHSERVTATSTSVVALICSAMFISNVTNAMFNTQAIQDNRLKVKRLIYGYLEKSTLSTRLTARLKQFMRMYKMQHMSKEQESQLMELLPDTLLADVRGEVRAPILAQHPFLKVYGDMHPRSMVLVCHNALQECEPVSGDIIFQAGDAATSMFFIIGGRLEYTLCTFLEASRTYSYAMEPQVVPKGTWISEAALWVVWEHVGEFVAVDSASVFSVHYQKFANVVQCHNDALLNSALYAKKFQEDLKEGHIAWTDMVPHEKIRKSINDLYQSSRTGSNDSFDLFGSNSLRGSGRRSR